MDEKYLEGEEEDLDEARSLTARYVQRSPTVPIKVKYNNFDDCKNKNKKVIYFVQGLCHTMKRQIISRAFYGWLTYTKQVNIVRRHLTGTI